MYNRNYDTIAERKGILQNATRIQSEIVKARKGKNFQKYSTNIMEYLEKARMSKPTSYIEADELPKGRKEADPRLRGSRHSSPINSTLTGASSQ